MAELRDVFGGTSRVVVMAHMTLKVACSVLPASRRHLRGGISAKRVRLLSGICIDLVRDHGRLRVRAKTAG